MDTVEIVNAVVAQDKEAFMNAFNAAIANKVEDALELKKVELASTLITPETETIETEVTDETSRFETEIDGAGSYERADDSATETE